MKKKYFVNLPFPGVLSVAVVAENPSQALEIGRKRLSSFSEAEIGGAAIMGVPEVVYGDSITIEGEEYTRIYIDAQDFAELLTALQPMQVYRLGDRLIYRKKTGQLRYSFIYNVFESRPL